MTKVVLSFLLITLTAGGMDAGPINRGARAGSSENPTLTFDSERYTLAYVGHSQAGPFNEYVRQGENLDTWTKMVGVYTYQNQHSARDFALTLQRTVRQNNPNAPCNLTFIPENGEAIVDFVATADKPKRIFELNIFRLQTSGEDVVAYQFAVRVYGPNRIPETELASSKQRWMSLIKVVEIRKLAGRLER